MKPVNLPGYEEYSVSEAGVVINTRTNRVLKTDLNSAGYLRVTLSAEGKIKRITVHKLVALTYLGTSDLIVNHKDGNKFNNHVSNLEWVTPSENRKHAFRHKLYRRPNSVLTDKDVHIICASIEKQIPAKDIQKSMGIAKHIYDDIRSRRYYKDVSVNYHW